MIEDLDSKIKTHEKWFKEMKKEMKNSMLLGKMISPAWIIAKIEEVSNE